MKLNNTQTQVRKAGMTLLELTVVILVLLSLISILFVGARAWKQGSDRSANIMNIRNCQQAMRGHQNLRTLEPLVDAFTQTDLELYIKFPTDVAGGDTNNGVSYTAGSVITPDSANPAVNFDHIWLGVGTLGLPGELYGHGKLGDAASGLEEITGW